MALENIYVVTDKQAVQEVYEKYALPRGVAADKFALLSTMNEVTVRDAVCEAVEFRTDNAQNVHLAALQIGFSPKPVLIDEKSSVASAMEDYFGKSREF